MKHDLFMSEPRGQGRAPIARRLRWFIVGVAVLLVGAALLGLLPGGNV